MSDEWEERRERERQEAIALEREKIAAAREIESRRVAIDEQAQAIRDHDWRSYPGRLRAQRHHDVLCLVLKEFVDSQLVLDPPACVERARLFADLAYPPPKAEAK